MYICPECGEKLDKNATICPCCGRGNKNNYNCKYDIILIVVGFIMLTIGIINTVSSVYETRKTTYEGTNYSFVYKNKDWIKSKKYKSTNDDVDVLVYNTSEQEEVSYIQFNKEMTDVGFDVDIDSSREDLYQALYKEMVFSGYNEFSNVSSSFKQIDDKYYIEANYNKYDVKGKMYIVCLKTKILSFYLVGDHLNSKSEEALLDIIKTIEIK